MPGKAMIMDFEQNFEDVFREFEDEQLKDVLKKRRLYQNEAARAAVREAINRELISSEDDLHAPEFRHEPLKPRLFPKIESPRNRNKIRKSVSRGLLLAGLLPVIWGMVRYNAGFPVEGILVTVFGIGWMGISASLIRRFSKTSIQMLFFFMVAAAAYIIRWMVLTPRLMVMDVFIIVVLFSFTLYGLLFLLRLGE